MIRAAGRTFRVLVRARELDSQFFPLPFAAGAKILSWLKTTCFIL